MTKMQIAVDDVIKKITYEFTPTGTLAFLGAGVTAGLAAMATRQMSLNLVLLLSFMVSFVGMVAWANSASRKASPVQACLHVAALAALCLSMIIGFSMVVPDPTYKAGSLPGMAAIAFLGTVAAFYISEFILAYGRRNGREKTPEIIGLAAASIVIVNTLGWAPLLLDASYVMKRAEQGGEAFHRVDEVYWKLKKEHPDIDLKPLRDAQKQIVDDAMRFPKWATEIR
ncbi:hypothetical protein [Rhizobium sp. BK176]|uniref:hypothetical protein n=1 Tax=Rhizobium sp. BK176 TaxID=2587071 RepID=UPI002169DE05|nr:hypothetical protein [Rhizobium sp. BK176]MCS4089117.1 hypothetical protein [Rhizobium sp. BK176]